MIAVLLPPVRRWTSPTPSCGTESESGCWERVAFALLVQIVEAVARALLPGDNTSRLQRGRLAPDKNKEI